MYCFGSYWACDVEGDWKRKGFFGKEKEIGRREFFYYQLPALVFRRSIEWVWWILIKESVGMGWMRLMANGALFLGCRGWMWVVYGKWMV